MKINNTGAGLNFTRAMEIFSDTDINPQKKADKTTRDIIGTISGKQSSMFDEETSRKIGEFLRAQIGDYDVKSGIVVKKIGFGTYLFTGEEARKARRIEREETKEKQEAYKLYPELPYLKPNHPKNRENAAMRSIIIKNSRILAEKRLLDMVENGEGSKPYTEIDIRCKDKKVNRIDYYSTFKDAEGRKTVKEILNI